MQRLLIDQKDITKTRVEAVETPELRAGQARLKLDRFALTANNVTYAAAGFVIGYWKFFPTGIDGQGLVPVWGFADVVESKADELSVGTRLYGFFPLAESVVIEPQVTREGMVLDSAAHRADLPVVYNRYVVSKPRPDKDEGLQALLQPLLATSYLLADWLQDNAFFNAEQVIIGSASSKTGLGLCKFLAEIAQRPVRIVGLTSKPNVDFVSDLKACDDVLSYDDVTSLPKVPSVYVDMAGNAAVKVALHEHLAEVLRHSCAVGTSHWDKFTPKLDLKGPKPQFFFAPAQIEKRREDWGPGVIERQIGEAWRRIALNASDWLDLRSHNGIDEAQKVYNALATWRAVPRDGHVIAL